MMQHKHIEMLIKNEERKSINLENMGLSSEDLKIVVELVNQRQNLIDQLNLMGNNIDNEGANILASLNKVRYLNLGVNDLEDAGIQCLVENNSIESLDVSSNNLSDVAAQKIIEFSQQTWINVDRNHISQELIKKIKERISLNKTRKAEKEIIAPQLRELDEKNKSEPRGKLFFFQIPEGKREDKEKIQEFLNQPAPATLLASVQAMTPDILGQPIKGELLESFDEILLGELEELTDIKEEETKNLLADILFENRSIEEVVKYVSEPEIDFGKRFAIIYCCMNPEKWEDPWMKEYKAAMLKSYIDRSSCIKEINTIKNEESVDWLKKHANSVARAFLAAKNFQKKPLSVSELEKKKEILNRIAKNSSKIEVIEDVKLLELEADALKRLISSEGEQKIIVKDIAKPSIFSSQLPLDSWKLTSSYERWDEIYELIKKTPKGHLRHSDKMLQIVRAILYKEEKGCRWSDLPPRNLPPGSTVRHYYYEWKVNGNLDKIKKIISEAAPTKRHTI